MSGPVAAFYGDDFTGAAENLAQFHAHGLRSRLYFEPASPERVLAEAPGLDVVGIAGVARSRSRQAMRPLLRDAFELFHRLGTRFNQYKICSTFDSAPDIGNFAVAIAEAMRLWPEACLPILPATPDFGRYTAFSNHFSRHAGEVLRLDRNPAMIEHPSTPMHEADLRRHLQTLGVVQTAAIVLPELAAPPEQLAELIESRGHAGCPVVLDTTDNAQLGRVCEAIWLLARRRPVFALAAQGLPQGAGAAMAAELGRKAALSVAPVEGPSLVLSGSCSPHTSRQLAVAEAAGWAMIELPVEGLSDDHAVTAAVASAAAPMLNALRSGRSVAAFTARGRATQPFDAGRAPAVGRALCDLFRAAVAQAGLKRAIFAGGDSSSFAMRHSGAYALEIAGSTGRQAGHVCRLRSTDELDGAEIMLKGGQAGSEVFFIDPLAA